MSVRHALQRQLEQTFISVALAHQGNNRVRPPTADDDNGGDDDDGLEEEEEDDAVAGGGGSGTSSVPAPAGVPSRRANTPAGPPQVGKSLYELLRVHQYSIARLANPATAAAADVAAATAENTGTNFDDADGGGGGGGGGGNHADNSGADRDDGSTPSTDTGATIAINMESMVIPR